MSVFEDIATQNYGVVGTYFTELSANITLALAALSYLQPDWTYQSVSDGDSFDFIVVGAGSAGSVVANRLTENPNWKVLLIEAGEAPPIASVVPGAMLNLVHTESDWDFYSSQSDSRSIAHVQPGIITYTSGKMLGGASSLGHLFYVRGNAIDYDTWAAMGYENWDYKTVLEYFKKSEGLQEESITSNPEFSSYHNTEGPLKVSFPVWSDVYESKNQASLSSLEELGFKILEDFNGPEQLGVGQAFFLTTKPEPASVRSSAAQSFLAPILNRENLYILPNAYATRVLIDSNKANGVEVLVNDNTLKFYSTKEVIVSCGTLNTPKLLMASGIGNKDDLTSKGIEVISDLPVGYDLQDHTVVPLLIAGRSDIQTNIETRYPEANINSLPFPAVTGFYSTLGDEQPNMQVKSLYFGVSSPVLYAFCLLIMDSNADICKAVTDANLVHEIFILYNILLHPESRGQVSLNSTAADSAPIVELNYLSDERDIEAYRVALKRISGLTETTYFKEAGGYVTDLGLTNCGQLNLTSDAYLDCYITSTIGTVWHPTSTCAMGKVVDSKLKVYGVDCLRSIDASVMPTSISGNTDAPTMMIAERASDLIKEEYGYVASVDSVSGSATSELSTQTSEPSTQTSEPSAQISEQSTQTFEPFTQISEPSTETSEPKTQNSESNKKPSENRQGSSRSQPKN